LAIAIPIV